MEVEQIFLVNKNLQKYTHNQKVEQSNNLKSLVESKPQGLRRIARIGYG
jgi:hypothetical protein